MNRLIAIGDIHGEIDKLNSLLDKIKPDKKDKIIFLGDYIDRGKNSKEVIDRLIDLAKTTECIFLKGNHEQVLLKMFKTKKESDVGLWLINGGTETLESYGNLVDIMLLHGDFFKSLKNYYIENGYLFVHGGVNPDKDLSEQTEDDLLWIREKFFDNTNKLPYKIIFGHTPFKKPLILEDKIGIDTGCGKGEEYKLTAIICNDETFITSD